MLIILANTKISDVGCRYIGEMLGQMSHLRSIHLGLKNCPNISDKGLFLLLENIKAPSKLTTLVIKINGKTLVRLVIF